MNLLSTVKTVAWSFVGLRSRAGFEQDAQRLNPIAVIAVAIAGALVFIGGLVLIVNLVVKS